jgi:NhaC family Na+:H+ antiporter
MGTAAATGAPLAATAGAVVSGAYLGDKVSPISDSTNICALGAGADLYRHIRHLLWTAVPSGIVALVVYALAGSRLVAPSAPSQGASLGSELAGLFDLGWWPYLPILVVLTGVISRQPPTLTLVASAISALVIGAAVQDFGVADAIDAAVNGFHLDMLASEQVATLSAEATNLLVRGGILSMAPLIVLLLAAFLMAGTLTVSGAFDTLLQALVGSVRSVFGLIIATLTAGITLIAATSQGTVTALVVGDLFRDAYKRRGLAPENLSRSLEDSVTIIEPLMPWTVSAIYMATTLGVPTLDYLPWAVFCYGGPLFSALIAFTYKRTGRGIRRLPKP